MTSFVGIGGGALRSIGVTARSPLIFRAGNWMIMSAVAGDAGTFIYASAEALASLRTIQADPTMDDGQKSGELLRIMGSLFISGAMLITLVASGRLTVCGLNRHRRATAPRRRSRARPRRGRLSHPPTLA